MKKFPIYALAAMALLSLAGCKDDYEEYDNSYLLDYDQTMTLSASSDYVELDAEALDEDVLMELKNAGLDRYHHNLEAAPSYFNVVCTTRSFQSQLDSVKAAKKVGLTVCSGGIFGIGAGGQARCIQLILKEMGVEIEPIYLGKPHAAIYEHTLYELERRFGRK